MALGGMPLTTTVEGLQRYTVNLRYDRDFRSDLRALREDIIVPTPDGRAGAAGPAGATSGSWTAPMGIKSEGAVPNAWVYVDIRGIDVGTYVHNAHARRERGRRRRPDPAAAAATTSSGAANTNTCCGPGNG